MKIYYAVVQNTHEGYQIKFPDFPESSFTTNDLAQVHKNAESYLESHAQELNSKGKILPLPTSLNDILTKTQEQGVMPLPIRLNEGNLGAKRINITLQQSLLERIDQVAHRQGLSRSGFIAVASRKMLQSLQDGESLRY